MLGSRLVVDAEWSWRADVWTGTAQGKRANWECQFGYIELRYITKCTAKCMHFAEIRKCTALERLWRGDDGFAGSVYTKA